jgi:MFS family permease
MAAFGLAKGIYDSNIWASLHDVVPGERRATAVGVMNFVGWVGGALGPLLIGITAQRFGLSAGISAVSAIYLVVGLVLVWGIRAHMRGRRPVGSAAMRP